MPNLSKKCEDIIKSIEGKISNKSEREFVLEKVKELSYIYMDLIDRITMMDMQRIDELEKRQDNIISTVTNLKETVDLIKNDIYEEEGYDFEIVCPYCNHEFVADIESELREEVECPECHNIIELDWDDDDEYSSCPGCEGKQCGSCNIGIEDNINNYYQDEEIDDEEEEEFDNENDDDIDEDM